MDVACKSASGSPVFAAQLGDPMAKGCRGHALQVERWVERCQHGFFEAAEGVRIWVWHGNYLQVIVPSGDQRSLVDAIVVGCVREDRAQGAAEGGELVVSSEVHAGDARP
jgi:hypothetical protein